MNTRIKLITKAVINTHAMVCRKVVLRMRAVIWRGERNTAVGVLI